MRQKKLKSSLIKCFPLSKLISLQLFVGMLIGLFFIVGRWNFSRLSDSGESSLLSQPRMWICLILLIISVPAFFSEHSDSSNKAILRNIFIGNLKLSKQDELFI